MAILPGAVDIEAVVDLLRTIEVERGYLEWLGLKAVDEPEDFGPDDAAVAENVAENLQRAARRWADGPLPRPGPGAP